MEHKLLIDGQWVDAGPALEVKDKYNGEVVGVLPTTRKEDLEAAIALRNYPLMMRPGRSVPRWRRTAPSCSNIPTCAWSA